MDIDFGLRFGRGDGHDRAKRTDEGDPAQAARTQGVYSRRWAVRVGARNIFDGLCDASFVGEAETTWPTFLDDFSCDQPTLKRYEQAQPTDMTKVPRPRFDLLKVDRYASGALQYSRGCPFQL